MITNYQNKLFDTARFKGKGITFKCGCYFIPDFSGSPIWKKCELHKKPFSADHLYAYQSTSLETIEAFAKGEIKTLGGK